MKKIATVALSLFLVCGAAFATTEKEGEPQAAKPASGAKKKTAKTPKQSATAALASELAKVQESLQSQQQQIQQLQQELARRDREVAEAKEEAAAASARAAEANAKATDAAANAAEVKTTSVALTSDVNDLKLGSDSLKGAVQDTQKKIIAAESPSSIHYKGITITPGGFIAAETVFRTRAVSGDINTPFTGIPYPGNALSKVSENNFTARQSRITLLAETKIGTTKVSGYYEADFLGAGTTSNNRQSNSYVFRQRQLWANATFENGFSVSAGQMWSLVTESQKGIANRREAFPLQIDPQYVVGWAWQRAYGFRVVKDFGKFAVGAAIEGPQTTLAGRGFPANFFINAPGNGGGLYNAFDSTGYTLNRTPDFIVKATADPGWGHYEVVGILSSFRNRVYPCLVNAALLPSGCTGPTFGAFNDTRVGGGVGATARFPIIAKKLDVAVHLQGGDGIGRYSSAQLADVTARPDGTLALIHSAAWLGTIEAHPNPKLDLYAYVGGEYAGRTAYSYVNLAGATVPVGYGSPLFNNSGCSTETSPGGPGTPGAGGPCAGDIHQIVEATLGFWHKFYNGPKGRVQWGIQYSYLTKVGWSGANGLRPKAVDNMALTSFRYYIP
jgi:hypothetical protein